MRAIVSTIAAFAFCFLSVIEPLEADTGDRSGRIAYEPNTLCDELEGIESDLFVNAHPIMQLQHEAALQFCRLPSEDITEKVASEMIGERELSAALVDDVLTLIARSEDTQPEICCSIQNLEWRPVGENSLWVARYRLNRSNEAMLQFSLFSSFSDPNRSIIIRGHDAFPSPAPINEGEMKGSINTYEVHSPQLGETKKLFVYLPPDYSEDNSYPALILADGDQLIRTYSHIVESMIAHSQLPPIIIIGIASGREGVTVGVSENLKEYDFRNAEYVDGFSSDGRFRKHMAFVADTIMPWAKKNFSISRSRDDRAVMGRSSGGGFAFSAGLLHPELFGTVISMSPSFGGYIFSLNGRQKHPPEQNTTRFLLSAGIYEHSFYSTTKFAANELRQLGISVEETYPAAGHMSDQWEALLPIQLTKAFRFK